MTVRYLHRLSAIVVTGFAVAHIVNHLAGAASPAAHIAIMALLRKVYRAPVVEPGLLAALAFQICTGLFLLIRHARTRRGFIAWLQAGTGAYIALFLIIHVAAILAGRSVLHLDTNIYYAAAGLRVSPYRYFFIPYYSLAIPALFTHLACAAWWRFPASPATVRHMIVLVPAALGIGLSVIVILGLAGALGPMTVPPAYLKTYSP